MKNSNHFVLETAKSCFRTFGFMVNTSSFEHQALLQLNNLQAVDFEETISLQRTSGL